MNGSYGHILEFLLGLPRGFLQQQGDWSLQFNPAWPGQAMIGASVWNVLLAGLLLFMVGYVYSKDGRARTVRILLGTLRGVLLAIILILLNRPILTLGQSRTEPSVLAIMVDDSTSMRVPDMGDKSNPQARLAAVQSLLAGSNFDLLNSLEKITVCGCIDLIVMPHRSHGMKSQIFRRRARARRWCLQSYRDAGSAGAARGWRGGADRWA